VPIIRTYVCISKKKKEKEKKTVQVKTQTGANLSSVPCSAYNTRLTCTDETTGIGKTGRRFRIKNNNN